MSNNFTTEYRLSLSKYVLFNLSILYCLATILAFNFKSDYIAISSSACEYLNKVICSLEINGLSNVINNNRC